MINFPIVKKIGIIAPARKISYETIKPAVQVFNNWGIEVIFGKYLFGEFHQFSGNDKERAADIMSMINRQDIDAIISARGGYGSARIVEQLNFDYFHKKFKWIIGYSDITVLHNALAKKGLPSLHATMPINFPENDAESLTKLKQILLNKKMPEYHFPANLLNRFGKVKAPITGGNLSVIYSLRGTQFDLDVEGKILFIEDLDEYLYHIDRILINFKLAGWFNKIKGLIIGGMENMHDNTIPFGKNAKEIIADIVAPFDFPVGFITGIGHTKKNLPLIFNIPAEMDVSNRGTRISF